MPATLAEIVSAAIQLSKKNRLAIVSQLLETMCDEEHLPDVEDDDYFIAEIQRRRQ